MSRYRFSDFVLSPRRRALLRHGEEQPLIPRYFDLLVFLVEHRQEALHRRDIFDRVWSDVVVSDSALSQAIRTLRRTLGDDPREPRFIRTVSRHGYRFVYGGVLEEDDDGPWPPSQTLTKIERQPASTGVAKPVVEIAGAAVEPLLERLTRRATTPDEVEAQREAAELLHALGTARALDRLGHSRNHAYARALLRDTRWDTPSAGEVPIFGQPAPLATIHALITLRLKRVARIVATRWASASIGGGLAGMATGALGGLILIAAPGSLAPKAVVAVLALVGTCCGAIGGAGIAAGLSSAEAVARSRRTTALIAGSALGGGFVGGAVQWLGTWTLAALVGVHVGIGGGIEGLVIGALAGLGYAVSTSGLSDGLAAPRGSRRLRVVVSTAASCGLGALILTMSGRPLVGGTIHAIAQASQGAQATLTPLGRLIGEPDFGPVSQAIIGTGEGVFFGLGLALGLTSRKSHRMLKHS